MAEDLEAVALAIAQLGEPHLKFPLRPGRPACEEADAHDFSCHLRPGGKRRGERPGQRSQQEAAAVTSLT
jgi:hypothetical protein